MLNLTFIYVIHLFSVILMPIQLIQQTAYVEPEFIGSAPPVPALYQCMYNLDRKPFNIGQAKACLDSILASKYFESGRIEAVPDDDQVKLRFVLKAPTLTIRQMAVEGVPASDRDSLLLWLNRVPDTLKKGRVYSSFLQTPTVFAIESFFRARGRIAAVSEIISLDYKAKIADVTLTVLLGPETRNTALPPPFGKDCKDFISSYNWYEIDDLVPVPLVDQLVRTRASTFNCFSAETLKEDQCRLEASGFFENAHYGFQGDVGSRQVSLRIKGKPLKVRSVTVSEYAADKDSVSTRRQDLPLKPGSIYRRSESSQCKTILEESYKTPDGEVRVYEDVVISPEGELSLNYAVMRYPANLLVINGKRM